jgi:hypothetical protein
MPTAPKAEVPVLRLPDWLPAAVREEVIKLQAGEFSTHIEDECEGILIRLACDERMKRVWNELGRKEPVCGRAASALDPRDPQLLGKLKTKLMKASDIRLGRDEGQRQFFRHAFFYAATKWIGPSVMSRSELNERKAPYAQAAEKLEALAKTLRSLGCTNYADQLKEMAPNVREDWREPDDDFWIVERHRARTGQSGWPGAAVLRRYIAELANFNHIVFGSVLYGTVATVTNVAFDLKEKASLTGGQVREILRAPPTPGL